MLIALTTIALAETNGTGDQVEIFLIAVDQSHPDDSTTFTMDAITTVWAGKIIDIDNHEIITWPSHTLDSLTFKAPNDGEVWSGWDWLFSMHQSDSTRAYGFGKYKISVGDKYFYLDLRDDRYGNYDDLYDPPHNPITGHTIDIFVKWIADGQNSYFTLNSYVGSDTSSNWDPVQNGSTLSIWDIKNAGSPSTDEFQPWPPENLSVNEIIPNVKHRLTWSHHSPADDYWEKYYIYRSITSIYPPNYILIDSALSTATTYLDIDLAVGTGQTVYYKVNAKNTGALSEFSNEAPEYTGPTGPPQVPSNFHVTWVTCPGGWNPKLEWNLITGDPRIHGYKLHRSLDGSTGPYSIRDTVGSSTSYFIDTQIIKSSTTKNSDYVHYKLQSYTYEQVSGEGPLYSGFAGPLACRYDEDGGYMPKQQANKDQVLPDKYLLNQNYPNPFNPVTSIRYALPKSSDVTLKIIDISGREVQTIVRNTQLAGYYEVQWNGQDESGRLVNTGTYFAHLQAGEFSKVIKMVYLR